MVFDGQIAGSGFTHVPGGDTYQNRSAFSFHYYCKSFVPDMENHPIETELVCDDTIAPLIMRAVHEDVERLGGAAMMTEGALGGTDDDEGGFVMGLLDRNLLSWTDYDASQQSWFETVAPNRALQEKWARTYAFAIAGRPLNMSFDPVSKDFECCFELDPSIGAPTEIFASTNYSYPGGAQVSTTPNLVSVNDADIVKVMPSASAIAGSVGCVWIARPSYS